MASLLRQALPSIFRRSWKPLSFPQKGFPLIPLDVKFDEETIPGYSAKRYFPIQIGGILKNRYQVVGKLGWGVTSTVWLARDLDECRHVVLKLYICDASIGGQLNTELDVYNRIEKCRDDHPGRQAVRSVLDHFTLDGPDGQHQCLVHSALWDSVLGLRYRNPIQKLPQIVVVHIIIRLFEALALLHEDCEVAHTDIKEANILFGADLSMLSEFEDEELRSPSPRKDVGGRFVYLSREMGMPSGVGRPILGDLGSCVPLNDGKEHREDIQPDIYRSPEVILDVPWTYSVDIWNVGCVVWDALQGGPLFTGYDIESEKYQGRAHLAEMIALLGPPPMSLLARANLKDKFFSEQGEFTALPAPEVRPLEQRETALLGAGDSKDRELFLRFMRKLLQWEPEKRSSARDLLKDEWLHSWAEKPVAEVKSSVHKLLPESPGTVE